MVVGAGISPLLANIAPLTLDEAWQTVGRRPGEDIPLVVELR